MLGQIVVEVKGMGNGIVMHNPDCMTKLPDGKGVDYKSKEYQDASFKYSQYRDKDDNLYQPSDHFMGAMVKAGARFKFEGKLSYAGVIEGGIIIEPDQILHKKGTKVEPFGKWVVVPPHDKKGARVWRVRAYVPEWTLKFTINVVNDSINFDMLKKILEYAGSFIGIGNWRPRYGRFEVVKFEKVG